MNAFDICIDWAYRLKPRVRRINALAQASINRIQLGEEIFNVTFGPQTCDTEPQQLRRGGKGQLGNSIGVEHLLR